VKTKLLWHTESASGLVADADNIRLSSDHLTRDGQANDQHLHAGGPITTTNTQSYAHVVRRPPVASSGRGAP